MAEITDTAMAPAASPLSDSDKVAQIYEALNTDLGTPSERKIFAVKLLPEARDWTVVRRCKAAGISRRLWYFHHRTPAFGLKCVKVAQSIMPTTVPAVLEAFLRAALNGDVRAQTRLLEDFGVLKTQQVGGTSVQINLGVNILTAPTQERQAFREGYAAAFQRGKFSHN